MSITTARNSAEISVRFPFELKNQFRAAFRSARWNASAKCWVLKSSSEKRLAAWVAEVEASGVTEALADKSDADLTERELNDLRAELAAIRASAQRSTSAIRAAGYTPAALATARADIAAAHAEADALRAQADKARAAQVAKAAVAAAAEAGKVADVINTSAVADAIFEIKNAMRFGGRKIAERTAFGLRATVEQLEAAGWESEALSTIANYNYNRFFLGKKPRSESGIDEAVEYVRA